jgi:hypothetical protein
MKPVASYERLIPSTADLIAFERNCKEIDLLVQPGKYPYIVAWGKWLGFKPVCVKNYLIQAEEDGAPQDSIQKIDGEWSRIGDVVNETNRYRVEALVSKGLKNRRAFTSPG